MLNSSLYQVEENLLDGRAVTIRALHPQDKALWLEIWDHLSPDSRYFRFLTHKPSVSEKEVKFFTEADFANHVILVALIHEVQVLVPAAVARYVVTEMHDSLPQTAEVGLMVEDVYQGLGLGTLLLKHLSIIAKDAGIEYFSALVHADNYKMLEVIDNWGLPRETESKCPGTWEIRIALR